MHEPETSHSIEFGGLFSLDRVFRIAQSIKQLAKRVRISKRVFSTSGEWSAGRDRDMLLDCQSSFHFMLPISGHTMRFFKQNPQGDGIRRAVSYFFVSFQQIVIMTCLGQIGGSTLSANENPGDTVKGRIGFSVGVVSPFGIDAYVPNKWGGLNVQLMNPTQQPAELLSTTYFEGQPTLQFGRRIWVPPRSRMQTWHPILVPDAGPEVTTFDLRTLVMDANQPRDVMIRSDSGSLQFDSILRRTNDTRITGLIDSLSLEPDANSESAYDLLVLGRLESGLSRQIKLLPDRMVPVGEECLQSLDQLLIADNRVASDPVGLAAIRKWLFSGGHLWVMLDRVDPKVLEVLLGDEFSGEVVDRVGLNTVRLQAIDLQGKSEVWSREHEQPVELVRMLVEGVEVAYRVDGWPAAFWKNCGSGRLLATTMSPHGWMRPRTSEEVAPRQSLRGLPGATRDIMKEIREQAAFEPSKYIALPPFQELASEFLDASPKRLLADATLEPQMREYVGYSIPSRWLIVGLLIGLSGILAVAGAWLWRQSRLELMGVIGPGLAISVSLVLVTMGKQQRQAVPYSVANVQFVQTGFGTDDFQAYGIAGLFAPEAGTDSISGQNGGVVLPDMTGQEGITRRMVWKDLGNWQWENLPETTGLRNASFQHSGSSPERIEASATFGPDGVTGHLKTSADRQPTDIIVATRVGRMGVEMGDDGHFKIGTNNIFASDQYLAAELLSDEQNRRRQILKNLLTDPQRLDYPTVPQMLFWTNPWDLGFRFGESRHQFGSALVAVPIKFERPPVGTEMLIPGPLLNYYSTFGPDDEAPSGLWDNRRRIWLEKAWPTFAWLRFQIPSALLPAQIQSGRLVVQVSGPIGKLEIAGAREKQTVPLKTWIDPVGTVTWDFTSDVLTGSTVGGSLLLRIAGGDPDRPELTNGDMEHGDKTNFWRIESLKLDLRAKTIEAN